MPGTARTPRGGRRLDAIGRLTLLVVMAGALLSCGSGTSARTDTAAAGASPLISRGAPVYASSELYPARNANDVDYSSVWRGSIPGWIALDLSRVPAARRARVVVAWFNDPITSPYDHTLVGEVAYNNLRDYTVEANAARGGTGVPPAGGWVTLATVRDNRYHSRTHLVRFKGLRWLRISVSAGDGSPENDDAAFNLDVYDASKDARDNWLFLGDSITMDGMHHGPIEGVRNFSQLVAAARPSRYPAFQDGGVAFLHASDGAQRIKNWISTFPGRYVGLSYGTNDANACLPPARFYASYAVMVRAVLAARKVAVVPTIPWARAANVQRCGPALNARIRTLYRRYQGIVHGPDLWAYFEAHPSLIGGDELHPSAAGYAAYRQQWAKAMLASVYSSRRKR